jgi:hypothetical protein
MNLTSKEWISLGPLGGLALVYWIRDKYIYNRANGKWYSSTRTQRHVLWFIWPVWIFLGWTLGLQTNRAQVGAALLTTTGQHIAGHYTVIGILNDSFNMTKQQLVSFFLGLLISFIWTSFWLTVTSSSDEENVKYIEQNCSNCDCNG